MQRRAQRADQSDQRTKRAGGLNRLLATAAALPVMLIVAGCSSDSGSGSGDAQKAGADTNAGADTDAGATVSAPPTVQPAAYESLPEACAVLSKKTLTELVPKGTKGKEGTSSDTASRASCSWSSLANNGVKGSQFRWLNVSLLRFESDAASSGDQQAQEYYAKQVQAARTVAGAANAKTQAPTGTGDQATTVRYDLKKKEGAFKQQTVVTRVENVVLTLDYNGAGLAGEKTPDAATLTKAAEKAAKEAVAAVRSANGEGTNSEATGGSSTPSASPSKPSSASPSASSSAKPSPSASKKS